MFSETKQNKYNISDIVEFKDTAACFLTADAEQNNFLYNKRLNTWNDYNILPNQTGIILEVRSIENTIKPEYQYWYKENKEKQENYIPYLWYCFKTAKVYLVYQCEME